MFTQFKNSDLSNELDLDGRGISCLNGDTHLLYWADRHNEIAFLVPSLVEPSEVSFQMGMDESTESHSISSSIRRTGSLLRGSILFSLFCLKWLKFAQKFFFRNFF